MSTVHDAWNGTFECWQNPRFGEIYARGTGRRLVTHAGLQHFVSRHPVVGNVTLYVYAPRSDGDWTDELEQLARRLGTVRLWVYSPSALESLRPHLVAQPKTLLVDFSGGEAALWTAVGGKTRNMVRRAERCGLSARPADGDPDVSQWWSIYMSLATTAGFAPQREELVRALLKEGHLAQLFVCEHEGRVVGGSLFLIHRYPMYWLGAVDRRFGELAPGHLTMWRAAVQFARQGFPLLDLGGIDSDEEGSTRFKKSFSRDVATANVYDVPIRGWKRAALAPFTR